MLEGSPGTETQKKKARDRGPALCQTNQSEPAGRIERAERADRAATAVGFWGGKALCTRRIDQMDRRTDGQMGLARSWKVREVTVGMLGGSCGTLKVWLVQSVTCRGHPEVGSGEGCWGLLQ